MLEMLMAILLVYSTSDIKVCRELKMAAILKKIYIRAPRSARRPRDQNVAAIALDRRFLGTIIAIFKLWLCPFNQPCLRHPMTKLK